MGSWKRGIRNVYRNKGRAAVVLLILGLSVSVSLTMIRTMIATEEQAETLQASVANVVEVRAYGATNMGQGADLLPATIVNDVDDIPNIAATETYLLIRDVDQDLNPPIAITNGIAPIDATLRVATHGEANDPRLIAGRRFRPGEENANVALLGTINARNRGISADDLADRPTVALEGTEVEVIGLFETGFNFGDNQIFLPMETARRIYGSEGRITNLWIMAESTEDVDQIAKEVKARLGDRVDVLTGDQQVAALNQALSGIEDTSRNGAILATVVGALVILLTMVLITRERIREIGLLKAIGASNGKVASQFAAESLAYGFIGGLVGLAVFAGIGAWLGRIVGSSTANLVMGQSQTVQVDAAGVTPTLLFYALGLAVLFGMLGALYPLYKGITLKPMEALRYE
jgi:ABC-type antimicrobial peptide transport system permease subunit